MADCARCLRSQPREQVSFLSPTGSGPPHCLHGRGWRRQLSQRGYLRSVARPPHCEHARYVAHVGAGAAGNSLASHFLRTSIRVIVPSRIAVRPAELSRGPGGLRSAGRDALVGKHEAIDRACNSHLTVAAYQPGSPLLRTALGGSRQLPNNTGRRRLVSGNS